MVFDVKNDGYITSWRLHQSRSQGRFLVKREEALGMRLILHETRRILFLHQNISYNILQTRIYSRLHMLKFSFK